MSGYKTTNPKIIAALYHTGAKATAQNLFLAVKTPATTLLMAKNRGDKSISRVKRTVSIICSALKPGANNLTKSDANNIITPDKTAKAKKEIIKTPFANTQAS